MRQVCTEVGAVLQTVATTEEEEDTDWPSPASAPIRFAAAVQAALNTGLPPASRSGSVCLLSLNSYRMNNATCMLRCEQ